MRTLVSVLILLIVSLVTPAHHAAATSSRALAFRFTTGGALVLSGTVEIGVDGTQHMVTSNHCLRLVHPRTRLPQRDLVRLRRLANSVRFAALPPLIQSKVKNVDMASRTISVYKSTGTATVVEAPYASNPRFDRLYAALRAAAPFTFDGPCRGMSR